uniref:Uncharacterized protein n=1 Tax=Cucumis melo TaxID=3656 RepID=A0A9I9EEZ2_CUCME
MKGNPPKGLYFYKVEKEKSKRTLWSMIPASCCLLLGSHSMSMLALLEAKNTLFIIQFRKRRNF